MQLKICDINIVKEFFGSFKDFLAIAFKPGVSAPSDDPAVLTKFLVSGMWVLILAHAINIGYWVLGGWVATGIQNFIQFSIGSLMITWITWFAYVKREPNCFFVWCICVEDFKFQHLIWGALMLFWGVCQVLYALLGLMGSLKLILGLELGGIFNAIASVLMGLYALIMVGTGLCLIKLGGKKAGIEIPDPSKAVGNAESAAESAA